MPTGGKKQFISAKCPKCSSMMSEIKTPMALVCVRKKGFGVAAQIHSTVPSLVVTPRRCPHCGYVELFSPKRSAIQFTRAHARHRGLTISFVKN